MGLGIKYTVSEVAHNNHILCNDLVVAMTRKTLHLIKSLDSGARKVEPNLASLAQVKERRDDAMAVTIKVAEPGYIPSFVDVRAQISPNLLTATITEEDLHQLEADPLVVSLGTPRRLHPVA